MGKKLNTFATGLLALLGIGLSPTSQANVKDPSTLSSGQSVSEKSPFYLEKFAQSSSKGDVNLLAWHSSHASHVSHGSHVSHQSGY
jgi:hypothetical protein